MDLRIGADVRGREDERLGELRRIVYDPDTLEVVSLVVEHAGFNNRDVVVPIGSVDSANADSVNLEFSRDQFDRMPDFETDRNVAPPPTADNLEGKEELEPQDVADVPAVGAATGVESIAFSPILDETLRIPEEDDVVGGDTVVRATDGELGHVAQVLVDGQTHRITGLIVEKGLIFKHDTEVPVDLVASVQSGEIILSVDRAAAGAGSHE